MDEKDQTTVADTEEESLIRSTLFASKAANSFSFQNETLFRHKLGQHPRQSIVIVDNFYANALQLRESILKRAHFCVCGNFPGRRTASFATEALKAQIQPYLRDEIVNFPMPSHNNDFNVYNGAFQITTSRDKSWVHVDGANTWAGLLFLTPFAPESSGTNFFRFYDGTASVDDQRVMNNQFLTDSASQDMTKWVKVDTVGNVFNRLVLFDSKRFHMSADYFGTTLENGRLFQVFFFDTRPRMATKTDTQ